MADCIHELPKDQCDFCSPPREPPIYWDAQYSTACPSCSMGIKVGDRVKWTRDGTQAEHARHGRT